MLKMKKSLIFCMLLFCVVAASAQTNIRKGSSAYGNVLYNWDGKNLRQGSSAYGPVIANWDGTNIRQGSSPYDKVIYNWDGKNLRQGTSPYGSILYNWDGGNIRKGASAYGSVIYNFDGKSIRAGSSTYGSVLYNSNSSLSQGSNCEKMSVIITPPTLMPGLIVPSYTFQEDEHNNSVLVFGLIGSSFLQDVKKNGPISPNVIAA